MKAAPKSVDELDRKRKTAGRIEEKGPNCDSGVRKKCERVSAQSFTQISIITGGFPLWAA